MRPGVRRVRGGQSTVELVCSLMIFTVMLLGLVDLISIVTHMALNEKVARNAARIAATQYRELAARTSASKVVREQTRPPLVSEIEISNLQFNLLNNGLVSVHTRMRCSLPVSIAGWEQLNLSSHATAPITSFLDKADVGGVQ